MKKQSVLFNGLNASVTVPEAPPLVLIMYGAGKSDQSRVQGLARILKDLGFPALTFDFIGHGESEGDLVQSSLNERLELAKFLVQKFFLQYNQPPKIIVAFSMSGQTTIQLIQKYPEINKIVLCSPGIYSDRAWELKFDEGFTEEIKSAQSYLRSEKSQQILTEYTGKTVLITPEKDGVVPDQVFDLIENSSKSLMRIIVPNSEHQLARWFTNNPNIAITVFTEAVDF